MALRPTLFLPLLLPILLASGTQPAKPETANLFVRAASDECGLYALIPCETVAAGSSIGLDYVTTAGFASKGDVKALRRLMRFTNAGTLDGAASEGHSEILGELLRHVGDAKFAAALRQESTVTRAAVNNELLYDTSLSAKGLARWYPRTSAAITAKSTPLAKKPKP